MAGIAEKILIVAMLAVAVWFATAFLLWLTFVVSLWRAFYGG